MNRFCLMAVLIVLIGIFGFKPPDDCKIMREGKFTYTAGEEIITVTIKDSTHTEYHNEGKYFIKSKIDWVNDCEFNLTITKVTIPAFPFGPGDEVRVMINRVEGKEIFYTLTVKAVSWDGKFVKVE